MANLEFVDFLPMREVIDGQSIRWKTDPVHLIKELPLLFWSSGIAWAEANHFALLRATGTAGKNLKTVKALMKHLQAYANWLEECELDWRHFPQRLDGRVLNLWRGELVRQREAGIIRPSTATARMNAAINFYRHADTHGFISRQSPMWREREVTIPYFDAQGFPRAIKRAKAELSIPNRARPGLRLEDGLTPLRSEHMMQLLSFLVKKGWVELHLMWSLGFFTGARIGTITTLRVSNVEDALEDSTIRGFYRIPVGPGTEVRTKFDVSGDLLVPDFLMQELHQYIYSMERLNRQDKAAAENRSLFFLTERGNPYVEGTFNRLMTRLRRDAVAAGMRFMARVRFHQSRCTYGTSILEVALGVTTPTNAIGFLKEAMLHKHEATTMGYVKFHEKRGVGERVADAFTAAFTGLRNRNWDEFHA